MKPGQVVIVAIVFTVVGALVGFALKSGVLTGNPDNPAVVARVAEPELDQIPAFTYTDLEGRIRNRYEWQNQVVVLNFWASWCPPCREETPAFVQLQNELGARGVQFVGIAIDDPEPVRAFATDFGINYPVLMGDIKAVELSRRLGNRFEGLPFTVVAGRDGRIALRHAGGLDQAQLRPVLARLLNAD